jgi:hypothetical protein
VSVLDTMSRTWDFWASGLTGGAWEVHDDPAVRETEPYAVGQYDVGAIVRDYQRSWLGVSPNHATPIDLLDLLQYLDEFTNVLEQRDRTNRTVGGRIADCDRWNGMGYGQTCRDLARWRVRLDEYLDFVSSVPVAQENDRAITVWPVTAPLLIGWYGGETGTEIPLDPRGFPPGFNPAIRHPADIGTPYSIANQMGIWVSWQDERKTRLREDLKTSFTPDSFDIGIAIAIGAALLGGVALLRK